MTDADKTTSQPVCDEARMHFLPSLFGPRLMIQGERLIYRAMSTLCAEYKGSFWMFHKLSNGGGFMSPSCAGPLAIAVEGNGFVGSMSAEAAGIVATLFALCQLAEIADDEQVIDRFHELRSFALDHAEASAIFAAID